MTAAGDKDAGPARFSPVSEVLPEGSPTESVLTAAEAESEINSGVLKSKQSSKEAYISQVGHAVSGIISLSFSIVNGLCQAYSPCENTSHMCICADLVSLQLSQNSSLSPIHGCSCSVIALGIETYVLLSNKDSLRTSYLRSSLL